MNTLPDPSAVARAVKTLHASKGRHNSQNAVCDLYDLYGLSAQRPDQTIVRTDAPAHAGWPDWSPESVNALVMLDRLEVAPEDEATVDALINIVRQLAEQLRSNMEADPQFMLQHSGELRGNTAVWLKRGGGYTTNIQQAELFTRPKAEQLQQARPTLLAWSAGHVRRLAQHIVDSHQLVPDIDLPSVAKEPCGRDCSRCGCDKPAPPAAADRTISLRVEG